MKTKQKVSQDKFEQDYKKIIKESDDGNANILPNTQWSRPGDYIVKFTLFQDLPRSITSSDTTVNL